MDSVMSEAPPEKSLYLFYENAPPSRSSYSLSKIDIQLTRTSAPTMVLPPILEFPTQDYRARGMKCGRLGSKLYFLGGTVNDDAYTNNFPLDVYVFDTMADSLKTMDARLNAGKPHPFVVFAANGYLYALVSIPYQHPNIPSPPISSMMLFERFDPSTNEWQVVDSLPLRYENRGIDWLECTVWAKRQQVVLLANEFSENSGSGGLVKFVYHLQLDKWTRHYLPRDVDGSVTLSFQEGGYDNYLYGLIDRLPPLKSTSGCISLSDKMALFRGDPVDGLAQLLTDDTPAVGDTMDWAKWVRKFFGEPYFEWQCRLLRYLGNGYFCYVASGMHAIPERLDLDGYPSIDPYTRGITVTLFKEKENRGEEKLCFPADILFTQDYVIKTPKDDSTEGPFYNMAELVGCFVVTTKKVKKKKNLLSRN